jgi:small-conductance mechanosensitive channel
LTCFIIQLFFNETPLTFLHSEKSFFADTMPLNTSAATIRMRLAFLFLSIIWLALAGLSSATVRFAVILRDRAKSDLATSSDSMLDITFQNLMDNIVVGMVIVALISALFSIFGIALAIHPRCLRENRKYRLYYVCTQLVVGLIVLSLGGYVASNVHGFQTSFELFDIEGHFPYYKTMYYGAVGQAAFGVLAVIMSLVPFAVCALRGH